MKRPTPTTASDAKALLDRIAILEERNAELVSKNTLLSKVVSRLVVAAFRGGRVDFYLMDTDILEGGDR